MGGLKEGTGVIEFAGGSRYEGGFVGDQPGGVGVYATDEFRFEGGFREGKMNGGDCRCVWGNGRRYDGGYVDDMKHGYGEFTYVNGKIYKGGWANNRMHGEGKIIYPDETVKYGLWENGMRVEIGNKMINAGVAFTNKPTGQTTPVRKTSHPD